MKRDDARPKREQEREQGEEEDGAAAAARKISTSKPPIKPPFRHGNGELVDATERVRLPQVRRLKVRVIAY